MGFRYRKSKKFGPFRLNMSKSGLGLSVGGKGFRYTKKANGGTRGTYTLPGTGFSYVKDHGTGTNPNNMHNHYPASPNGMPPPKNKSPLQIISLVLSCVIFAFSFFAFVGCLGDGQGFLTAVGVVILFASIGCLFLKLYGSFIRGSAGLAVCAVMFIAGLLLTGISSSDYPVSSNAIGATNTTSASPSSKSTENVMAIAKTTVTIATQKSSTTKNFNEIKKPATTDERMVAKTAVTTKKKTTAKKPTTKVTNTTKKPITTQKPVTTKENIIVTREQSQMVWISDSGKKYHSHSGCSNMKNPHCISIDEAKSMGYSACKRCY